MAIIHGSYNPVTKLVTLPGGKQVTQAEFGKMLKKGLEISEEVAARPAIFGASAAKFYQEGTRSAKASAAFFNAQIRNGSLKPDLVVANKPASKVKTVLDKAVNYVKSLYNNGNKAVKTGTNKVTKMFTGLCNNTTKAVKNGTGKMIDKFKGTNISNPFKGTNAGKYLKTGAKVAIAAAIVAGVVYLGKKAYDYFANKNSTYAVKENDNLWNIAKEELKKKSKNGQVSDGDIAVRTDELIKLNGLEEGENGKVIIKPGQKIKLK